jgi:MAS20 protein import receptor
VLSEAFISCRSPQFDPSAVIVIHHNIMESSSLRISTVMTVTAGAVVTGFIAYAVYFDHRRRTDPNFRKTLKREARRQAKAEQQEQAKEQAKLRSEIRDAIDKANRQGYPTGELEREQFFMDQIQLAEELAKEGKCQCKVLELPEHGLTSRAI